ncbi:hypothetical protein RBSWK_04388 [Rhodopirellula baltica SWK14]|uniref:Uncharacterized protein n=1 Tax=Rhodopirellula baltica SWK14 TaxID=993516 RepID=L7CE33_RHOBT|nr:hypothetical protein RBSWK_04388 [Rhodopirellula baltica SWK14]
MRTPFKFPIRPRVVALPGITAETASVGTAVDSAEDSSFTDFAAKSLAVTFEEVSIMLPPRKDHG